MEVMEKIQKLLKEIFQFDCADLGYGIYRVLNYKRKQVDKFINEDLRNKIESAFTCSFLGKLEEYPKAMLTGERKFSYIKGKVIMKLLRNFQLSKIRQIFFISLSAWAFKNKAY
ncbi:MAG: hypothetical protein ABIM45_01775 [candidate division WOR-3 bacterium]